MLAGGAEHADFVVESKDHLHKSPSFTRRFSSMFLHYFWEGFRDYFALGRSPPVVVRKIVPQVPTAVPLSASVTETP
jgi:hypothetical protein